MIGSVCKEYGRTNVGGDTYVCYLDFSDICTPIMPVEDRNISNENNQALIIPSQSHFSSLLALWIFTQGILSFFLPTGSIFFMGTASALW